MTGRANSASEYMAPEKVPQRSSDKASQVPDSGNENDILQRHSGEVAKALKHAKSVVFLVTRTARTARTLLVWHQKRCAGLNPFWMQPAKSGRVNGVLRIIRMLRMSTTELQRTLCTSIALHL